MIQKKIDLLPFLIFTCTVIVTYLIQQPSWGTMDDHTFLWHADRIWESDNVLKAFADAVVDDWKSQKMRPIYVLYFGVVYKFFENNPTLLYCLIFIIFGSVLPLWGIIFHRCYRPLEKAESQHIFLYPLTFFLFPPFWNIFMYISLQEKLIFFFSTFAVYFLVESYQNRKPSATLPVFVFVLLTLFSKPMGIYIVGFIIAVAAMDLIFIKENKKLSTVYLIAGLIIIALYYIAVKKAVEVPGYSAKYVENLSVVGIFQSIMRASIVLKILLVAAVTSLGITLLKRRAAPTVASVILPVGYIVYIVTLAPWALVNYLLAPAAPFIFGMFYPVYLSNLAVAAKSKYHYWPNAAIIILTFLFFAQIIVPRISKVAEIRKAVGEIVSLKEHYPGAKFFFPPPFDETRSAISNYSQTPIEYLSDRDLSGDQLTSPDNFLIFRDECDNIRLSDVFLTEPVYANTTWRIFRIDHRPGHSEETDIKFQKTFLQKITEDLRDR